MYIFVYFVTTKTGDLYINYILYNVYILYIDLFIYYLPVVQLNDHYSRIRAAKAVQIRVSSFRGALHAAAHLCLPASKLVMRPCVARCGISLPGWKRWGKAAPWLALRKERCRYISISKIWIYTK